MRLFICLTLAGLFSTNAAAAPAQGKSGKHAQHERDRDDGERSDANVRVHVVFTSAEVTVLRNYYEPRYRNLPPGLQKKVARGGQLPPGWRKKFEPFPNGVEQQLSPLPAGYRRGVVDGHAIIYNPRTNVIVDLAVLF
jgi:Ni/Co efflux regulator RcnB